ncbi:pol polyprotein [Aphelenchoides avenae]|nr:pol polyprotein [Aphelenchus avenae]
MDLLGPLPLSQRRFRYVLTATDALTKWITAVPLRNQTADEVKNAFEKEIICHFGVPTYVVSDCGTNLLSKQFAELADAYSFKRLTISPYHQQSNGQAERSHSTLANMISAYANDSGSNWCSLLAPTTFAYNCSIHRVTGRSPFQMLFVREPRGRMEDAVKQEAEANFQRLSETMKQLREAWKLVRAAIEEKTAIRDAYRDEKVGAKQHDFREGELVLRKLAHERMEHKFAARYEGPYKIIHIQKPNAFIQKLHEEATPTKVHFDLLKPFKEPVSLPYYATEEKRPEETEGIIAAEAIAAAKKAGILALKEAATQSYRPVTEEILKVYEGLVAVNIHADEKLFEEPGTDLEVYVAVNIDTIAREEETSKKEELPTIAVCNGTGAFSEETYYKTYFGKPDENMQEERRAKGQVNREASKKNEVRASEESAEEEEDRNWSDVSESECTTLTEEGSRSAVKGRTNRGAEKKTTNVARPERRSQADERCRAGAGRPECRGQADVHRIDTSSGHSSEEVRQQMTKDKRPECRGPTNKKLPRRGSHP